MERLVDDLLRATKGSDVSKLAIRMGVETLGDLVSRAISGFHVTWAASAILLATGGLVLIALLRRRDVAAVADGEAAPAVA